MKSKISSSFPTSTSEFNFPSWPESPTDNSPFVLPNFPAADARQQISTSTAENDSNPFFAPALQPEKPSEETTAPQSPFGIPLSSLAPAPESRSRPARRLLSFIAKSALVCLFAAIGWIGYGEFVAVSGKDTIAKQEVSSSPQSDAFVATAMVSSIESSTPLPAKRETTTDIRKQISESTGINASDLYLKLASLHQSFGAMEDAEKALREGLVKDHLSAELTLSLADNLTSQGKKNEAWLLLAKSTRTGDKRFGSRILALGLATGKHDETLMLLDPEAPGAPEWDNEDWITIARLYEKSGNTEHTLKL